MNKRTEQQYRARAEIARALAHPTRLVLLDALSKNEMCVSELTELIGADQSTVSKHLALLKGVGLVGSRREGTTRHYRNTCSCLDRFFGCIESVLRENLKIRQEAIGD